MMMIPNPVPNCRRQQIHTIVSKELIKPSSPTPCNLKTYNLSIYDQTIAHLFMPMITFYPNTGIYHSPHDITLDLKNSLSHTLTKYYPFAGTYDRFTPACVDCNDNGVEFFEASIDTTLSDFLQDSHSSQDLDQFFPHALDYSSNHHLESEKLIPLMVQINHFECGGVAVAVSISHKIADATSFFQFMDDWAKMTRFCSTNEKQEFPFPIDPEFIYFPYKNINSMGLSSQGWKECVTRSFVFPNSKINHLKLKVKAMTTESGKPITNPTRFEVMSWLIYKCAVAAATKNNSGSFKPTGFRCPINIRSLMMEPLPEKSVGNFYMLMEVPTQNESEMKPESIIGELRKQKMQFQGLRNIETVFSSLFSSKTDVEEARRNFETSYNFSNLCGCPIYDIDFGWGKPVKATIPTRYAWKNCVVLMDTPNRDGIEALVSLGKEDMDIFQTDPELLAFT